MQLEVFQVVIITYFCRILDICKTSHISPTFCRRYAQHFSIFMFLKMHTAI